jgi:hypothetical protein
LSEIALLLTELNKESPTDFKMPAEGAKSSKDIKSLIAKATQL